MSFFMIPKLNYINNQLKQIETGTSNQDVLNSVISYINTNSSSFTPELDYTKLNADVQAYMNSNINLFKGPAGSPYVIPQADLDQAVSDFINSHPTDFVKTVNGKSNVVVLNQGDIQPGVVNGTILYKTNLIDITSNTLGTYYLAVSDPLNSIWFFRDYSLNATSFTIMLPSPTNLPAGTWVKISNASFSRVLIINSNGYSSTNIYSGMTNEAVVVSDPTNNGSKSWYYLFNTKV